MSTLTAVFGKLFSPTDRDDSAIAFSPSGESPFTAVAPRR